MLAALEICDEVALPHDVFRLKAHVAQQRLYLAPRLHVRCRELQMIALLRVSHAAAREKRPAQKRSAAALLLQQRKVQVQRKMRPPVIAERAPDRVKLFLPRDAQHQLAALMLPGKLVEFYAEGLLEEARQPAGKLVVFRHDAHLARGKGAGVQQNAAALRHRAAAAAQRHPAQLRLYVISKRHALTFPLFLSFQPRVISR